MMYSEAYKQGQEAFYAETPDLRNPYDSNTQEWRDWHQGLEDASNSFMTDIF